MTFEKKVLSLKLAKKMAEAIEAKANEMKAKIVIAIVDDGGNLKYFQRMDGVSYGSVRISQLKAATSASLPFSTRTLGESNSKQTNGPLLSIPDLVLVPGGLPIIASDGQHLGGVGVSGVTSDADETLAQAGLDAIKKDL